MYFLPYMKHNAHPRINSALHVNLWLKFFNRFIKDLSSLQIIYFLNALLIKSLSFYSCCQNSGWFAYCFLSLFILIVFHYLATYIHIHTSTFRNTLQWHAMRITKERKQQITYSFDSNCWQQLLCKISDSCLFAWDWCRPGSAFHDTTTARYGSL
jgi:hypothetical protein